MESNQRGTYRIEYPRAERPELHVGDRVLEVLDCSETGLRYALPTDEPPPALGGGIRGRVRFSQGEEAEVEGEIRGVYGRSVAVRFTGAAIPYARIFTEQKRLRSAFLALKNRHA